MLDNLLPTTILTQIEIIATAHQLDAWKLQKTGVFVLNAKQTLHLDTPSVKLTLHLVYLIKG